MCASTVRIICSITWAFVPCQMFATWIQPFVKITEISSLDLGRQNNILMVNHYDPAGSLIILRLHLWSHNLTSDLVCGIIIIIVIIFCKWTSYSVQAFTHNHPHHCSLSFFLSVLFHYWFLLFRLNISIMNVSSKLQQLILQPAAFVKYTAHCCISIHNGYMGIITFCNSNSKDLGDKVPPPGTDYL